MSPGRSLVGPPVAAIILVLVKTGFLLLRNNPEKEALGKFFTAGGAAVIDLAFLVVEDGG